MSGRFRREKEKELKVMEQHERAVTEMKADQAKRQQRLSAVTYHISGA
jgi:hypothetical protein